MRGVHTPSQIHYQNNNPVPLGQGLLTERNSVLYVSIRRNFVEKMDTIKYRPVIFLAFVFLLTWICAFVKAYINLNNLFLIYLVDFIESSSPLIVTMVLLRKYFTKKNLVHFIIGKKHRLVNYFIVLSIFVLQLLNFYLFRINNDPIVISTFITIFLGQVFLGGGLEEAGWRGYLQPAFEKKIPIILSVIIVGIIWTVWHLPYFFLPNSMHSGANFIAYVIIGIITAFILVAIYKLTGSIVLCTLFHGWQNTIVMTIPANQEHIGFMIFFLGLGIISIIISLVHNNKLKRWYVT